MKRRLGVGLVLLVCVVGVIAAGPPVQAQQANGYETIKFKAKAADKTILAGHVFLPTDAPRPLATVLHFSPYFGGASYSFANTEELISADVHGEFRYLIDAGFAVAAVSMRGTGRSEGCLQYGGPLDRTDGATVIQALAAQPWSNGNVGMYGLSYPAWSQFLAASQRPPALKAIVPVSGVTDSWNLLLRNGAPLAIYPLPSGGNALFPSVVIAATGHSAIPQNIEQALCEEHVAADRAAAENTTTGNRTRYYEARDIRPALAGNTIPTLATIGIIGGGNDGHILQLEDMFDHLGPSNVHFVLGQWSHWYPTPDKPEWHDQVIGWFDHYLRGGPQTVPTGVVEYQYDDYQWATSDHWPPAATPKTMHLSGQQVVDDGEPVEPVDSTFVSTDRDPGLKTGPDETTPSGDPGRGYNSVCGPGQALFVSEPFAEDTSLAGNVEIDLEVTSDLSGGNLSVILWRTTGTGDCPDDAATWFVRSMMDLRHWQTLGQAQNFPVGTPTQVSLNSEPFAARLRAGERLVVAVGGGNTEIEPDPLHPTITVTGGTLRLPVVADTAPVAIGAI